MPNKRELDLVEQLLRQRRPGYSDKVQRLCWERGFLTGLVASMVNLSPDVRRMIKAKMTNKI